MRRFVIVLIIIFLPFGLAFPAMAEEAESESLRNRLEKTEKTLKEVEGQLQSQQEQLNQFKSVDRQRGLSGAVQSMNPKISLDGLFAAGASSAPDLQNIETGGHDPNQRGFTVQNVELTLGAAVDPYFNAATNLVFQIDRNGESFIELEEAYLTSTSLPYNLQVKAGQFFTSFGRLNPTHPHAWDFADQPLVNGRFLGPDGLRNPGVQLSYLLPVPIYMEAILAIQNGSGGTAFSFRNKPGEIMYGRTIVDRPINHIGDLLFVPRLAGSFDLSETETALIGVSGAFGPNGTGVGDRTALYGADLYYKWKPLNAEAGWPFLAWQTEGMLRYYDAGPTPVSQEEKLKDRGVYSQILWGLKRSWIAGFRVDYVAGQGGDPAADPLRSRRLRLSPNVTFYPSEFSKWRLQYNHDDIQGRDRPVHSVFVQWEFLIGEHGAHKF